jgi:formylglycine-generating enzyme required for sulfatase activity
LRPYWLDQHEVTVGEFLRGFHGQLPPSLHGREDLLSNPELPLTGLLYDEAVMFAEMVGKRLPAAVEYEFAATNGWRTRFPWGNELPPKDAGSVREVGESTFDRNRTEPPIFGLFSNASEFVATIKPSINPALREQLLQSDLVPGSVAIRGRCDHSDVDATVASDAMLETFVPRLSLQPHVGFRCVKSRSPRL